MVGYCHFLTQNGYKPEDLLIDESAPDEHVTLQAEVKNGPTYLGDSDFIYMRYVENSGLGMRQAYPLMQHIGGIRAVTLLRHYLDPSSQDDLFRMLADYPDSIVELSCYPFGVGKLNRNCLFWEVRTGY
jgi:hypothetical protein